MKNHFTRRTVVSSILWKVLERSSTQVVQFAVQIALARLLLPDDFGTIGIIMVFINLAAVFINGGLSTALIQKRHVGDMEYSTVFYISLSMSIVLNAILYGSAPVISQYFAMGELEAMLRVLSFSLVLGVFIALQQAFVARTMMFRKLFYSGFVSAVLSGILGILLAYAGYGVWALVMQHILSQCVLFGILWFTVPWRPKFLFSYEDARVLFSFGWKVLVINLLNSLNENFRTFVIGKRYTQEMLGYYSRGKTIPQIIINNITVSVQSVMLPTMSSYQDDIISAKSVLRRTVKMSAYFVFPMMLGMVAIADSLIVVLLTEKWLASVPFIRVFSLVYLIYPVNTANLQAITSLGRSDILLRLEVLKKLISVLLLVFAVAVFDSTIAVAWSLLLSAMSATLISMYPVSQLLNYRYSEQFIDILPSLALSVVMGALIQIVRLFELVPLITMVSQIMLGCVIYLGASVVLKLEAYGYVSRVIQDMKPHRDER